MNEIDIKIKRLHPDAMIPQYAHMTDAGMDLTAVSKKFDEDGNVVYGTGLAVEIPEGYVGLLFPRSSCSKKDVTMSNCVGVIDSGYRGEITAKFKPSSYFCEEKSFRDVPMMENPFCPNIYEVGDRIAQLIVMPYPRVNFTEVEELSETERGEGGYGSTGK